MPRLTRFVALCFALFASQLLSAQATFSLQRAYQTGANPQSVVSDDFNKDGNKDVAIADYDDEAVELHYGNSFGTFDVTGTQIHVTEFPKKLLVADLNKDGYLDLIVLEDPASDPSLSCGDKPMLEILFGGANGFQGPDSFCVPDSKPFYVDMGVADVDGNGWLDVVMLAPDRTVDTILFRAWNTPDNFTFVRSTANVSDAVAQSLALADINGDGKPDLVMSACCANGDNSHGQVSYLPGNGDGTFGAATEIASRQAAYLVAADINDDGRPDIVATLQDCVPNTGCDSTVAWFPNFGTSLGHANIVWESIDGPYITPRSPVVGDFTGDGHDDIAFLVTDQKFQTAYDFLFVTDVANGATAKIELGDSLGARSIAWTKITATSSLPDLMLVNSNVSTFIPLANTTDLTGGLNCNSPDFVGMNVCLPEQGSTTNSNGVRLLAAASVLHRTFRYEVWENGSKIYTARETDRIDTQLDFVNGTHNLTFVAYNSDESSRTTKTVSFTVGAASQCSAPTSNGINVCTPANGASVSSPVAIRAAAKVSGAVYRFELWVDGVKKVTVRDSGTMQTAVTMSSGSHKMIFVAYNSNSSSRVTKTVSVTVR